MHIRTQLNSTGLRKSARIRMMEEGGESAAPKPTLMQRWSKIAGVVALYWFISISMVFLNKYLLSSEDLKLNAALFVTGSQCVVAVIAFVILGVLRLVYPDKITFPAVEFNTVTLLKVLPLSVVFVGMIVFNNLTLKYLGVAFYNVGRSLTTVFNVALSYLILQQTISIRVVLCCGIIVSGFLLGVEEEDSSVGNLNFYGVAAGVTASLCVALYAIFTKKVLPLVGDNIWTLQYYNNINACLFLIPLSLFFEYSILAKFQYWTSAYFWSLIVIVGLFGIAIGYVTSLQIQVTSPLTHNVSGTAKACAQTILACVVYSQSKPVMWWLSNFMVLGGSSAYTYVKMLEMKAMKSNTQQTEPAASDVKVEDEESGKRVNV